MVPWYDECFLFLNVFWTLTLRVVKVLASQLVLTPSPVGGGASLSPGVVDILAFHLAFADKSGSKAVTFPTVFGWSRVVIVQKFFVFLAVPVLFLWLERARLYWSLFCLCPLELSGYQLHLSRF